MSALYDGNLRGSRLGMVSYENDGNVDFAARQAVRFECPNGHTFALPFSLEAEELPATWECRCGSEALREEAAWPEKAPVKTGRSHWDMVMERRTISDMEEVFFERLALLRESRGEQLTAAVKAIVHAQQPSVVQSPASEPTPVFAESRSA